MLVGWGSERADAQSPPVLCYVEATQAGSHVYLKNGYKVADTVAIPTKEESGEPGKLLVPAMIRPAKRTDRIGEIYSRDEGRLAC